MFPIDQSHGQALSDDDVPGLKVVVDHALEAVFHQDDRLKDFHEQLHRSAADSLHEICTLFGAGNRLAFLVGHACEKREVAKQVRPHGRRVLGVESLEELFDDGVNFLFGGCGLGLERSRRHEKREYGSECKASHKILLKSLTAQ